MKRIFALSALLIATTAWSNGPTQDLGYQKAPPKDYVHTPEEEAHHKALHKAQNEEVKKSEGNFISESEKSTHKDPHASHDHSHYHPQQAQTDHGPATPGAERAPAAAQGMRHMFEFTADSAQAFVLSFDKIKTENSNDDSSTESNLNLDVNYAYGVHRYLQIGSRLKYFSGVVGNADQENFEFAVGGIANLTDDFTRSAYASLYFGLGWAQQFGAAESRDNLFTTTIAIGKRFSLEGIGIKHVTYTPEIAIRNVSSTNNDNLDYSRSLQFRLLQFSVFF